jgi:glyoxylase-like metal-dependent hydrolase (beta-lactamase superfamily II)
VTAIPFVALDDPQYGEVVQLSPLVRRVVAQNPSKFTYHGTGTYIVGHGEVAVIDPGPQLDSHRDALLRALRGEQVSAILVTHCHADHVPLARWLREQSGAATVGFGPHPRLDDPDADDPVAGDGEGEPGAPVEETTDHDFSPDVTARDGDVAATGDGWSLRALHTPGHTSNHLCFALDAERSLFTGDHVMGWSTTVITPPDGDMRSYLDSLRRVQARADEVLLPTHGAPVTDPGPFLDAFMAHRLDREAQVLSVVRAGVTSVTDMVEILYADVRPELHKPAGRSVLAHLVKLIGDGLVGIDAAVPSLRATYRPT